MKKILLIHNKYRDLGGEDIAVENEINLLKKTYEVKVLYLYNNFENFTYTFLSFFTLVNIKSNRLIKKELNKFNPDYVYIHNTWFKVSLGVFKLLEQKKIKTILKLHNFRYYCTKNFLFSNHLFDNTMCQACGVSKNSNKLLNVYFKESILKSLLVLRYGKKYFNILKFNKIKILVLTNFHRRFLEKLGVDKGKIVTLPNYLDLSKQKKPLGNEKFLLYAGRISEEKGIKELIYSFLNSNLKNYNLKIVGEGPYLEEISNSGLPSRVEFLGHRTNREVLDLIEKSYAVVTATKLYEGQPNLLCEASSLGKISIFPDTGGISEFFPDKYKYSFKQFDYNDLIEKFNLLNNKKLVEETEIKNKFYIDKFLEKNKIQKIFENVLDEQR